MAFHAKLSASGSKKWMHCPGSLQLEQSLQHIIKYAPTSDAAMEGTCAHAIGEECLASGHPASFFIGHAVYIDVNDDGVIMPDFDDAPADSPFSVVIDAEMAEQVQTYIDYCLSLTKKYGSEAEVAVERYLEMKQVHPELGGTADFIIAQPYGTLEVVDLKFGKGVMVEVDDNPQLQIYALGALHYYPDCEDVKVTIVQPRKPHSQGPIRSVTYTLEELKKFKSELIMACLNTQDKDAALSCGDWCTWCPCLPRCEEVKEVACDLARLDFSDIDSTPETPTTDRLGEILPFVPVLEKWLKAVKACAKTELELGRPVEGQKLVRGRRGDRKFKLGMDAIIRRFNKLGFKKKDCCKEPGLLSPAQMEKIGTPEQRDDIAKIIEDTTERSEGKPTIAPENDPREAIQIALLVEEFDAADAKAAEDALGGLL